MSHAVPGKSTNTELLAPSKGAFDDAAWEEIDPAEVVAEPPAAKTATGQPDGARGRYAEEHRKLVRDYRIGNKQLAVSDLAGRHIGIANQRSPQLKSDRKISVDLHTVIGSRRNNYRNAYVLVWKDRDDGTPSNDPTGWIKVGKLPRKAQRDIAEVQNEKRREQRRGSGAGHDAKTTGERITLAPQNPTSITEKWVPRPGGGGALEAFRLEGGSASTPLGNYTHNPARYGDNIVAVWNPPGSSSGGKRNIGSGGIRAFLPLSTEIEVCDVKPIVLANGDTAVGTGSSTWIYATARVNGERIYFWLLRSWTFTAMDGSQRNGSNG